MPIKSIDDVYVFLVFIVPGLIILFVRSQFITGRRPSHAAALLSYLTMSVVYYALILPFIGFAQPTKVWTWFLLVFVGPVAVGFLLGLNVQKDLFRGLLRRIHIYPVHSIPTAWDWKFSTMKGEWALVTLKNGKRFAGVCGGPKSFVSSEPAERDLYISWVHDIGKDNVWRPSGDRSVLITSGEISTITFWPISPSRESGNGGEQ